MVTPTNHVIAGPDLHRAGPLALWRFSQHLYPNISEDQKKSYDFSEGPLTSRPTAPYCGKSGPHLCITFIKRLDVGLRLQLLGRKLSISFGLYALAGNN